MAEFEMSCDFLKTLYQDIMDMLNTLVVKRYDMARGCETLESARNFELYLACLRGDRYFFNFRFYDLDILLKYMDPARAKEAAKDPRKIPVEYRKEVTEEQAQCTIETFEETNEYYRMLMGLPKIGTTVREMIYVRNKPGYDSTIPIHEYTAEQIAMLENDGTLNELKKKYPDAGYLDYLGNNKIDLITARLAKPYEILRLGPTPSAETREMFMREYHKARRYVMASIDNSALFHYKDLYYPFIGVLILSIAIRNTMVPTESEYYNFEEILNAILRSYGLLEYFKKFPFIYKQRLVLALDKILANKGTDGVLIDICKLFNFDGLIANRYYLMKTHAKDSDGNILFTGDPNTDYNLDFVKASIEENEIDFNSEDLISYEEVTTSDYLWQLTQEEKEKMLKDNFNLMMTKYIDVEIAFDVTALSFEICCFNNLILYSRYHLQSLTTANMYSTTGDTSVWGMLVFMLAIMAKRANFDGNIIYEPEDIAEILRFNYGDISEEIQQIVDKYELQIDVNGKLLDEYQQITLAKPTGNHSADDMVKIYVDNRKLYEAIQNEMAETGDIRRYEALAKVRDILYYSAMEKKSFQKPDGESASTYREMLDTIDAKMGWYIDHAEDEHELNDILLYVLEKLEAVFNSKDLKYLYLGTANLYGSLIGQYLRTAINVFKASSVQLQAINIILYAGEGDPIRIIDNEHTHKHTYINECVHVFDTIATKRTIYLEDTISFMDKGYTNLK